jgi:hypothetical protein
LVNQVRQILQTVTSVFRWAVDRDLVPPTKVVNYRGEFGRDALRQVAKMTEYKSNEREQLIAALDPRNPAQWRAELDKMGDEKTRPMTDVVVDAMRVAYGWPML